MTHRLSFDNVSTAERVFEVTADTKFATKTVRVTRDAKTVSRPVLVVRAKELAPKKATKKRS